MEEYVGSAKDGVRALRPERASSAEGHRCPQPDKADLEKTVSDSRAAAEAQAAELRNSNEVAKERLSIWWDDQQKAWNDHLAKLQKDVDEKKAEHDASKAERKAGKAQANADFAVKLASAAIDEAEYAVLSAIAGPQGRRRTGRQRSKEELKPVKHSPVTAPREIVQ
jgi:hypothetical protein